MTSIQPEPVHGESEDHKWDINLRYSALMSG